MRAELLRVLVYIHSQGFLRELSHGQRYILYLTSFDLLHPFSASFDMLEYHRHLVAPKIYYFL